MFQYDYNLFGFFHRVQGVDQSSIFPWRQREILTFDVPVHDTEKAGLGEFIVNFCSILIWK